MANLGTMSGMGSSMAPITPKGIWARRPSSVSDSAGLLTSTRRHCRYLANSRHSLGIFTWSVRGLAGASGSGLRMRFGLATLLIATALACGPVSAQSALPHEPVEATRELRAEDFETH